MLVLFAHSYNTQPMVDTMSCNSLLIIFGVTLTVGNPMMPRTVSFLEYPIRC